MRLLVSITTVSWVKVESEEQAKEYKQKIRDNDYSDIEEKFNVVDFEAQAEILHEN